MDCHILSRGVGPHLLPGFYMARRTGAKGLVDWREGRPAQLQSGQQRGPHCCVRRDDQSRRAPGLSLYVLQHSVDQGLRGAGVVRLARPRLSQRVWPLAPRLPHPCRKTGATRVVFGRETIPRVWAVCCLDHRPRAIRHFPVGHVQVARFLVRRRVVVRIDVVYRQECGARSHRPHPQLLGHLVSQAGSRRPSILCERRIRCPRHGGQRKCRPARRKPVYLPRP